MGRPRKYSPEVRERAVRLVFDHEHQHDSQWATIWSVADKIGCTAETLRHWVRQAERDVGRRPGLSTEERARMKEREREVRRANEILRKASAFFAQAELDRRPRQWWPSSTRSGRRTGSSQWVPFCRLPRPRISGALTPLYVKTAAQEASLSCWRVPRGRGPEGGSGRTPPACAPRLAHGPTSPNTSTPRARRRVHAGRLDATRRRRATPASVAWPTGRRQRPHARRASRPGRGWDPRDWPRSFALRHLSNGLCIRYYFAVVRGCGNPPPRSNCTLISTASLPPAKNRPIAGCRAGPVSQLEGQAITHRHPPVSPSDTDRRENDAHSQLIEGSALLPRDIDAPECSQPAHVTASHSTNARVRSRRW